MIKDLVVTYANNIAAVTEEYWLRIEQVTEEAAITTEEASTLVDSLYDINPCIEETAESTEETEVTQEKLYSTAVDVFGDDLEACRSELAGDYVAEVKVWQSHLLESYKLELSAGEVIETVRVFENLSLDLDVKGQSSIDLEYPVASTIAVAWIGAVLGAETSPEITLTGTVLSWGTLMTGTIRVEFTTAYDLVTVSVPGIPEFEGAEVGDTQSVKILGFFHRMVFIGEISPPEDDTTVTNGALVQLCGYLSSGELGEVEPPAEPTAEEIPKYGCIDSRALWTNSSFYEEKCCVAGTHDGCVIRTERNPGGVEISEEDIEKYTLQKDILDFGPDPVTEFIPVSPTDPKGCGTIYWNTVLTSLSCCDIAEPIVWDDESTPDILPADESIWIYVTGGIAPYTFKTSSNGTWFPDGRKTWVTDVPHAQLHAGPTFCGLTAVSVSDGCSSVSEEIRADQGEWYFLGYTCKMPGVPIQTTDNFDGNQFQAHSISGRFKQTSLMSRRRSGESQTYREAIFGIYPHALAPSPGDPACKYGCFGESSGWQRVCDCMAFDMSLTNLCLKPTGPISDYEDGKVFDCANENYRTWIAPAGALGGWICGEQNGWSQRHDMFWYDADSHLAYEWRC